MLAANQILCCDCVEGMKQLPEIVVPLTVTSPPYGSIREYGGHRWSFPATAKELYRVTMPGGILVWVVQEQIVNGAESGDASRQRLFFIHLGFRCHQTLVMVRPGGRQYTATRYGYPPEYAFVLSKGVPRCFHPLKDQRRKDLRSRSVEHRRRDGTCCQGAKRKPTKPVRRNAFWTYGTRIHVAQERYAFQHPALMPEKMDADLMRSWSNVNDLILDPFAGAGTTLKMALLNYRRYFGFEVHSDYVEIARRRLYEAEEHRRKMRETLTGSR